MSACKFFDKQSSHPLSLAFVRFSSHEDFLSLRPYDDAYLIAAQLLAISSLSVAWVWWATGIVNIVGMLLFQIPWCCRQRRGAMYFMVAVGALTSLSMISLGLYILFDLQYASECYAFSGDIEYGKKDWCNEILWASIAFVCAVIWGAATHCMLVFVGTGRHAKWEKYHSTNVEDSTERDSPEVERSQTEESLEIEGAPIEDPPQAETVISEMDNRTVEIHEAILVPDDYSDIDVLVPDHIYKNVDV